MKLSKARRQKIHTQINMHNDGGKNSRSTMLQKSLNVDGLAINFNKIIIKANGRLSATCTKNERIKKNDRTRGKNNLLDERIRSVFIFIIALPLPPSATASRSSTDSNRPTNKFTVPTPPSPSRNGMQANGVAILHVR